MHWTVKEVVLAMAGKATQLVQLPRSSNIGANFDVAKKGINVSFDLFREKAILSHQFLQWIPLLNVTLSVSCLGLQMLVIKHDSQLPRSMKLAYIDILLFSSVALIGMYALSGWVPALSLALKVFTLFAPLVTDIGNVLLSWTRLHELENSRRYRGKIHAILNIVGQLVKLSRLSEEEKGSPKYKKLHSQLSDSVDEYLQLSMTLEERQNRKRFNLLMASMGLGLALAALTVSLISFCMVTIPLPVTLYLITATLLIDFAGLCRNVMGKLVSDRRARRPHIKKQNLVREAQRYVLTESHRDRDTHQKVLTLLKLPRSHSEPSLSTAHRMNEKKFELLGALSRVASSSNIANGKKTNHPPQSTVHLSFSSSR